MPKKIIIEYIFLLWIIIYRSFALFLKWNLLRGLLISYRSKFSTNTDCKLSEKYSNSAFTPVVGSILASPNLEN